MRVLLVEDEIPLATALAAGLRSEGHGVDVAHDGSEGLWCAEENTYDVIVLDVMLPQIDGYDVCRQLRAREDWTPVLMLTARDADRDAVQGLDVGADDYVTKPFSFEVLLARLRSLARRQVVERPTQLVSGDLILDPARRSATRQGADVGVTAREFAVLELLMRHEDQVVSKRQLLDGVWGFGFDGDPNIVEVYVGRLRRKVNREGSPDVIETVRGLGYRLRAVP